MRTFSPESCLREAVKIARESQENGKTQISGVPEMLTPRKLDVVWRMVPPFTQFASNWLARRLFFIFGF